MADEEQEQLKIRKEVFRKVTSALIQAHMDPARYNVADSTERLEMIKDMVRGIVKDSGVPLFSWRDLQEKFEENPLDFIVCAHQVRMFRVILHYEEENKTLRQRMEDLCEEMERVRQGEGRTIICGPGVEECNISKNPQSSS